MGIVAGVVVYVMLWWLVLFTVLPWGVRRQDAPEAGFDPGAPEAPRMWLKLLVTTVITTALWFVADLIIASDWISFREP
ncbi:MAG: DUF1467 family protein [Alphaproteobacteria bacterium]